MVMRIRNRPTDGKVEPLYAAAASNRRKAQAWLNEQLARCRADDEVFSVLTTLSPELAELLLERNDGNRKLKPVVLNKIRADIEAGRWELNGEPIIVADTGELNDGQHRCWAVVNAGRPVSCMITFGVRRESRTTVDQGAIRTTGDYLAMSGVKNGNAIAAIATLCVEYERTGRISSDNPSRRPTKSEVVEWAINHPKLVDSLNACRGKNLHKISTQAVLGFCHWMFRTIDANAASVFMTSLISGAELRQDDPIFVLRERLMNDRAKRRYHRDEAIELLFRAWNMWRRGERIKKLQVTGNQPALR